MPYLNVEVGQAALYILKVDRLKMGQLDHIGVIYLLIGQSSDGTRQETSN